METNGFRIDIKKRALRSPAIEYGETLRRRRKDRGITLLELSEKTRIHREVIEAVELGKGALSEEDKQRIKKFFRRQRII